MSRNDVLVFGDDYEMHVHTSNRDLGHLHATLRAVDGHVLEPKGPSDVIRRFRMLMRQGHALDGVNRDGSDTTKVTFADRVYGMFDTFVEHPGNPHLEALWFPPVGGTHQALTYQLILMLRNLGTSLNFSELMSGVDINYPPDEVLPFIQPAA